MLGSKSQEYESSSPCELTREGPGESKGSRLSGTLIGVTAGNERAACNEVLTSDIVGPSKEFSSCSAGGT